MSILNTFQFKQVEWKNAAADILKIRQKVFIIEQRFDKTILSDRHDNYCSHILVTNQAGKPVACGRLTPNGRVGHIAVLMDHRGQGVGTMVLGKLIKVAQRKSINHVSLNAETELTHFYHQQQFHADGPVYMKQGIPFQKMTKKLA